MSSEGATAETVPEQVETPLGRARRYAGQAFGILGLLDIISGANGLLTLSASLKFLAGWWHWLTDLLFGWLPFHIPADLRSLIIIASVTLASADILSRRKYGQGIFRVMISPSPKALEAINEIWESPRNLILMTVLMAIIVIPTSKIFAGHMSDYVRWPLRGWGLVLVIFGAANMLPEAWLAKIRAMRLPLPVKVFHQVFLAIPFNVVGVLVSRLFDLRRSFYYCAAWVLGALLLNEGFKAIVDPLAPLLANLPPPPLRP